MALWGKVPSVLRPLVAAGVVVLVVAVGSAPAVTAAGMPAAGPRVAMSGRAAAASVPAASVPSSWPWSAPQTLAPRGPWAGDADVAISSDARVAIAVWSRYDGVSDVIESAVRRHGEWGPVSVLSPPWEQAHGARVAMAADGSRAVVVWTRHRVLGTVVQAASWGDAGWGPVQDISPSRRQAGSPTVTVAADGSRATAAWSIDGTGVQAASWTPAGWSAPDDLQPEVPGELTQYPSIASSADGHRSVVLWWRSARLLVSRHDDAGWTSAETLSDPPAGDEQPGSVEAAAMDASGDHAVVLWSRQSTGMSVRSWDGGSWSAPTAGLALPTRTEFAAAVSADAATAVISWPEFGGAVARVGTAYWRAGTWAAPRLRAAPGMADAPQVALSADGLRELLAYRGSGGIRAELTVGSRATAPVVVGPGTAAYDQPPAIAMAAGGDGAIAAWVDNDSWSAAPRGRIVQAVTWAGAEPAVVTQVRGWPSRAVVARAGGAVRTAALRVTVTPAHRRVGVLQVQRCRASSSSASRCAWVPAATLRWPGGRSAARALVVSAPRRTARVYRLVLPATTAGARWVSVPLTVRGA